MNIFLRRHWFKLLVWSLCIVLGAYLIYLNTYKENKLPVIKQATDFQLQDTTGEMVSLANTKDKIRLVYFFFSSCPDVCIPTTAMISQLRDALQANKLLGDKVILLSITFDPERDTTARLTEFAARFDADPANWKFLRGDEGQIHDLAKTYGVEVFKNEQTNDFAHNNRILIVDQHDDIRASYVVNGRDWSFDHIVKDITNLAKES